MRTPVCQQRGASPGRRSFWRAPCWRTACLTTAAAVLLAACAAPLPAAGLVITATALPAPTSTAGLSTGATTPVPPTSPAPPPGSPTPTGTPALTSTPIPRFPANKPSSSPSPSPSPTGFRGQVSELLYLSDGDLMRWNHLTGQTRILTNRVSAYTVSANGKRVAVLKSQPAAAGEAEHFSLLLLDADTTQPVTLLGQTTRLFGLAISPDGRWLAYTNSTGGGRLYILQVDLYYPNSSKRPTSPALATVPPPHPAELGVCLQADGLPCTSFRWSPDSTELAWSDARGVWLAEVNPGRLHQLAANQVEVSDPRGQKTSFPAAFQNLRWSPDTRFLLATINSTPSGASWEGIVDAHGGRVVPVPDTYALDRAKTCLGWLQDGNLYALHGSDIGTGRPPRLVIWQVTPTRADMLLQLKAYNLVSDELPALDALDQIRTDYVPAWPAQTGSYGLGLGITLPETGVPPVLFGLDIRYGSLQKVSEIPYDTVQVLWALDQSGALVVGWHGGLLFVPTSGEAARDMRPLFGPEAGNFTWLPPVIPRS